MDTQTVPTAAMPAPLTWGQFKSYDEANKSFKLLDEDSGYVLKIQKLSDPTLSPFIDLDDKGNPKPPAIQTMVTFLVVDYANDDEADTAIGQTFTQYFKISMHTRANFYKLVKAAFGGQVDPAWSPDRTQLEGKLISAVIKHKDENDQGQVYPKVSPDGILPYRGRKTYDDVVPARRDEDGESTQTEDVPF